MFAIATLIDHHRRNAKREVRTATAARAEITADWTYLPNLWCWADCAFALDQAARHRRLLAALYQLARRDGREHMFASDYFALQERVGLRHAEVA